MTDKDKIKFAIRYLKKGLKSKRTPPLYEVLMNELGYVSEKELGKVEGKLADLTSEYYELENLKNNEIAELKDYRLKTLAENQTDVQKYAVNLEHKLSWYDEQLLKAKEIIKRLLKATYGEGWNYSLQVKVEAEKFLKEYE